MREYQGRWYLIEKVPALVCDQCGEVYYSMAANDMVVGLVRQPNKPERIEQVAVLEAVPH